jgi:hypothetical protein
VPTTFQAVEGIENIPLINAVGRVTAAPVIASMPLPVFDQAAVDGYGISKAHLGGTPEGEISQRLVAGDKAKPIEDGAAGVFSDAPVPVNRLRPLNPAADQSEPLEMTPLLLMSIGVAIGVDPTSSFEPTKRS